MNEFDTIMAAVRATSDADATGDKAATNTSFNHLFRLLLPLMAESPARDEIEVLTTFFRPRGEPKNIHNMDDYARAVFDQHRTIFPVIVMRHLLAGKRVTIDTKAIDNFCLFSERYQEVICKA